jgi:ribosomal protein S18 acetylase RimI-like enzyme
VKAHIKNSLNALIRLLSGLKRPSRKNNVRRLREHGETLDTLHIREAKPEDVTQLAALHVKTWNETYSGVRQKPTYSLRESQWHDQFNKTDGSWFCFVIENSKGELIGFAKGKEYDHPDLPDFSGDLNKIYVLAKYQRLGLGRKLVRHVVRKFLEKGINSMVLFGDPKNPSCGFHDALQGKKIFAKNGEFHGAYGWHDLKKLYEMLSAD